MIDAGGLQPLSEKITSIQSAPAPKNITQLKSFLCMLQFYNRFLPNLATLVAPLYTLLRKGVTYGWGKPQLGFFNDAKECLVSPRVLIHFDQKLKIILSCDASPTGVGAVLAHQLSYGSERLKLSVRDVTEICSDRQGIFVNNLRSKMISSFFLVYPLQKSPIINHCWAYLVLTKLYQPCHYRECSAVP